MGVKLSTWFTLQSRGYAAEVLIWSRIILAVAVLLQAKVAATVN